MSAPLVLPSLLLALVLAISAIFKLRDLSTAEDAFVSLRLPSWLRDLRGPQLLPYVELVLSLALVVVPAPLYLWVTVAVTLLFVAYLVVIIRALGFEQPVVCGCFGKLGLGEVDLRTAVRNGMFVALGVLAVADAVVGHSVIHRLGTFGAAEWAWLVGVAVAIALSVLVVMQSSEKGTARAVLVDDPAGEETDLDYQRQTIPYGMLRDGEQLVTLRDLAASRAVLLVFLSVGCGSCMRTMELLPEWAKRYSLLRTIAVSVIDGMEGLPDLGEYVTWMSDPEGNVGRLFQGSFPSAVLLGADGMVAGGPVTGAAEVKEFLDEIGEQLSEVADPMNNQVHEVERAI